MGAEERRNLSKKGRGVVINQNASDAITNYRIMRTLTLLLNVVKVQYGSEGQRASHAALGT